MRRVLWLWSGIGLASQALAGPASAAGLASHPSCAVVGDSIAVGAGQFIRKCKMNAKSGIPSRSVIARVDPTADVNVISAGSNDPDNPILHANLERIRSRAARAVWILPIDSRARAAVQTIAVSHGDPVVSFVPARDRVHPRSDAALARSINAVIGEPSLSSAPQDKAEKN
jgi:hypothetical protein